MIYNWWIVRIPALLLLPGVIFDLEVLILLNSFLILHLTLGIKTILNDYFDNKTLQIFLLILIRLTSLEFLRYVLEFLI